MHAVFDEREDIHRDPTQAPNGHRSPESPVQAAGADSELPSSTRRAASTELHVHELLALLSCFVFPAAGAFLLHTIRSQLSRPSEGLVSNYNLTIFLLASEVRPTAHLFRMLQARTLYLQRMGFTHPYRDPMHEKLLELAQRVEILEAKPLANGATHAGSNAETNHHSTTSVISEVRKTLQPDVDALNRAVRRYEKRATLQTMQTESRLQDLEARLNDAISLAAAATQSGPHRRPAYGSRLFEWAWAAFLLPLQGLLAVVSLLAKASSTVLTLSQTLAALRSTGRSQTSDPKPRVHARGKERVALRSTKRSY